MGDLIHKTKVVPFIDTGKNGAIEWTRIKKSTAFTLSLNPQTKTFDFISSEQPEEEIDNWQPSLSQSLVMFKDEPDYEHIFAMLFELPTGARAHRPALVVFYAHKAAMERQGTTEREAYALTTDEAVVDGKAYYAKEGEAYVPVASPVDDDIAGYYERTTTTETTTETVTVYMAWKIDALVKVNQMDTVNESIDFDLGFNAIERGAVEMADGKPSFMAGTFDGETFTPAAA